MLEILEMLELLHDKVRASIISHIRSLLATKTWVETISACHLFISSLHFCKPVHGSRPMHGGANLNFSLPNLDFPKLNIGITAVRRLQLVEVERAEVKLENLTRAERKNISIVLSEHL